jgi:hypothetical protein
VRPGPFDGLAAAILRGRRVHLQQLTSLRLRIARNLAALLSFSPQMKDHRSPMAAGEYNLDRRIIRVDIPPAHAGITAALRRAFEAAAADPCQHDFDDLLRKLN